MIDWTWITSEICLIIYYDYINKKVIRFWFYDGEKYEYIKKDLDILKNEFKYEIKGFVVDWAKQIKKAIEEIYPTAKIQRCLTHIHRQIKNYISNNPKSDCWKDLQKIITFEKFKNKENFLKEFNLWEKKYFDFLKEKSTNWTNSWYTHRKLRWARSHIKNAIPYMFYFLEDENIKKSSNDLEWYNWLLNHQIFNHKWLRNDRLISFISLWIYNRNLR
jgi:transposase-like protein